MNPPAAIATFVRGDRSRTPGATYERIRTTAAGWTAWLGLHPGDSIAYSTPDGGRTCAMVGEPIGTFWGPQFLRVNEEGVQVFRCATERPVNIAQVVPGQGAVVVNLMTGSSLLEVAQALRQRVPCRRRLPGIPPICTRGGGEAAQRHLHPRGRHGLGRHRSLLAEPAHG
mgnify:CR=1 FL=1